MKIACYFGGRTNLGGAERRIGRVMNCLAQKGVEVTFVFFLYESLSVIEQEYKRLVGDPFRLNLVGFDKQIDLYRFVKTKKFDSVFYTGPYKAMLPFFLAGKMSGSQTVLLQVTTGPSVRQFKSKLEMLEFEFVARGSSRIDCLYPSTTEAIQNRYRKQVVTTTPCPSTDLQKYHPEKKEKVLAFISRWMPGKNVELFIESMLLIEGFLNEQGYKVVLCGGSRDGGVEKNVEALLSKAKYPHIFERPGYVDSVEVLPKAEVFFSLQRINNYPSQSLLEAIACGCYVIASDEGDTRILVKDEFGTCIALDSKEIAHATQCYINQSKEQKAHFQERARQFALNKFNINYSVDHYYGIISNNVVKGK